MDWLDEFKGQEIILVFREEGREKVARGRLVETEGQFYGIRTEQNLVAVAKADIVKIKLPGEGEGGHGRKE